MMRNQSRNDSVLRAVIIVVSLCLLTITAPAYAAEDDNQPSQWAAQKIGLAQKTELIPESFNRRPFTEPISRGEFCTLLLNAYGISDRQLPEPGESHAYLDSQDPAVEQASQLGLIQGTGDGYFHPDQPLSREMAAAVLGKLGQLLQDDEGLLDRTAADQILRDYAKDGDQISAWARVYFAQIYAQGIIAGGGDGRLDPQGKISREQAVIIVLNLLAYCDKSRLEEAGAAECVLPAPSGMRISPVYQAGQVKLVWNEIPSAAAYDITISKDGVPVYQEQSSSAYLDFSEERDSHGSRAAILSAEGSQTAHLVLEVAAVNRHGETSQFSLRREFAIRSAVAAHRADKPTYSSRSVDRYANAAEAAGNMTRIQVKVWHLAANGGKKAASATLTVHQDVAAEVAKIFAEIYQGSEKFPIKICSGFAYRTGSSQHSNGTAIDINPDENYFLASDGSIKAGSCWQPGKNPYSIPANGDVVKAFNKYGWHWSPDMNWSNGADYMHFSLAGI